MQSEKTISPMIDIWVQYMVTWCKRSKSLVTSHSAFLSALITSLVTDILNIKLIAYDDALLLDDFRVIESL